MRPATILCALTAVLATGCAASRPAPETAAYALEAFRWTGDLAPGTALTAHNDWGDLHVVESADGKLLVSGMIQKIGGSAEELAVEVLPGDAGLEVRVTPRVARPRGRADLTLMVPDGHAVALMTTTGDIRVREFEGAVTARSERGDITATRVRAVDARTDGGAISVALMGRRFRAPIRLVGKADVEVRLSEAADLDVGARAAHVEVSLPADRLHDVVESSAGYSARIGGGGPLLQATSFAGSVRIGPLM